MNPGGGKPFKAGNGAGSRDGTEGKDRWYKREGHGKRLRSGACVGRTEGTSKQVGRDGGLESVDSGCAVHARWLRRRGGPNHVQMMKFETFCTSFTT